MTHVITFSSGKGGVGKSTAAVSTASIFAKQGIVAFADLDPDAYATSMGLGVRSCSQPLGADAVELTLPGLQPGRFRVFPGGEGMDDQPEYVVAEHLKRCAAGADVLVIDTPPDRRHPTVIAALRAASVIVVPVLPEFQALAGYEKLLDTCRRIEASAPTRVLLSRWEARTLLAQDVQRLLVSHHPGAAISAFIPRDQRVAEATAVGRPSPLFAPRSASSVAFATAAYEIAASAGLVMQRECVR